MNKSRLLGVAVCAFFISASAQATIYNISGSFEQLDSSGHIWGSWANGVSGAYNDQTGSISMYLDDLWGFHNIPVTGEVITTPGIYSWEACLPDGSINCTAPTPITAQIGTGQWGMHGLYTWTATSNIDLVNVWNVTAGPNGIINLSVIDSDGNGVLGVDEVDGPFEPGSISIALNLTLTPTAVPIPGAVWLFGSGLLGLIGMARRKAA